MYLSSVKDTVNTAPAGPSPTSSPGWVGATQSCCARVATGWKRTIVGASHSELQPQVGPVMYLSLISSPLLQALLGGRQVES